MALTKVTGQVINTSTDVTVGVLTVTNTLAVGGTVSIGGTLTYEDVTNIDSVGLITARNGIIVGSGITLSKDGDIFATGVTTATSFVGDGSQLTGVASTENIRTNTNATFLQNINVSGSTTTGSLVSSGAISGTTGTFSGAVSGTTGTFSSDVNVSGELQIADYIVHIGDGNTALRFPSDDTITAQTNATERARIDSSGRLLLGTTTEGNSNADNLTIADSGSSGITIRSGTSNSGSLFFSDATSGADEYIGFVQYSHSSNYMIFGTSSTEALRIEANGNVKVTTGTQYKGLNVCKADGGIVAELVGFASDNDEGGLSLWDGGSKKTQIVANGYSYFNGGNVGINEASPTSRFYVNSSHYVVTSSGESTTGIHIDGTHGNAGEYGGGISFNCGGVGCAAIAARQATSSAHVVGLSFFTHDSSTSSDDAVEKVRIHDGGATSFAQGIVLGNGLTYSSNNKLDDYEEGTWTAALSDGETCTSSRTRYTKIGCLVTVYVYITQFSDFNGNTNTFKITGLPFTSRNEGGYHGGGSISYAHNFNYSYPILPLCGTNATYIYFHRQDGTTTPWHYQDFHNTGNGTNGQLVVQFTYETAS